MEERGRVIEANVIEEKEGEKKAKEIEEVEEIQGGLHPADRYYYEEKDYYKASEAYLKLAEELDDIDLKLKARYMYAESLVKLKRIDEAVKAFEDLANSGEDSYIVESAKRRAKALKE